MTCAGGCTGGMPATPASPTVSITAIAAGRALPVASTTLTPRSIAACPSHGSPQQAASAAESG